MSTSNAMNDERKMTRIFERYLTVRVGLCIVGGIILGKVAPGIATYLDGLIVICRSFLKWTAKIRLFNRFRTTFPFIGSHRISILYFT